MEKVRKAEVPPPSNFNRRVTPELDAISLKALARDVADRYQSAAQLAADLDALIAGYRFDPKELRQFVRQLFRKEYAKELEETETALEAEPGLSFGIPNYATPSSTGSMPIQETPTSEMQPLQRSGPVQTAEEPPSVEIQQAQEENKPRGFWGNLFKRKK
jgi:serine/threonine protein kinase